MDDANCDGEFGELESFNGMYLLVYYTTTIYLVITNLLLYI